MSWKLKQKAKEQLAREVALPGAGYHDTGGIRACLLYPNTYAVGMSNLGFQTIHQVLNTTPGISCERAFLPDRADEAELERSHTPLFSLETQRPLAEFDLLGISLSYDMDSANAVRALLLAGIPPLARDRDEHHPLVIAGGPCVTYNPEPLAEFMDACVIGEGEEVMEEITAVLRDVSMARGSTRADLLAALARVPGVYVPSLYDVEYADDGTVVGHRAQGGAPERVTRRWVCDLDRYPCAMFLLTPDTEFGDMFCVEISRGCGRSCRFCIAGYVTRPPRLRSRERILSLIEAALPYRKKVGLVSPSLSDYPDLSGLIAAIGDLGAEVSASSLRADTLLSAPVTALAGSGETSITIAPEAGSQRLRHALNKSMTDEDIYAAAESALAAGIRKVKLYLMVGLPTESDEDLEAIATMCRHIADLPGMRSVSASVNPFVPKPGTPFQWCGMASDSELSAKIKRLRSLLKGHKKVDIRGESPRDAVIQAALSRGDRRLAPVILSVAEGDSWNAAFRRHGMAPGDYAGRQFDPEAALPWDVVDLGVTRESLLREWEATCQASERAGGGLTSACRVGLCHRCGVCPPDLPVRTPDGRFEPVAPPRKQTEE